MDTERSHEEIALEGIIIAEDWDDDLNLVSVRIIGSDGEDYLVENDATGEELLELVEERVFVTGIVRENEDGSKVVAVEEWDIVERQAPGAHAVPEGL